MCRITGYILFSSFNGIIRIFYAILSTLESKGFTLLALPKTKRNVKCLYIPGFHKSLWDNVSHGKNGISPIAKHKIPYRQKLLTDLLYLGHIQLGLLASFMPLYYMQYLFHPIISLTYYHIKQ